MKLCDKFSIDHYPMLFWGSPKKFVGGSWQPKQEKNEISVVDEWRTSDLLLKWINKKIGRYLCTEISCLPFKFSQCCTEICFLVKFAALMAWMIRNLDMTICQIYLTMNRSLRMCSASHFTVMVAFGLIPTD